jgi:hypothetical protein
LQTRKGLGWISNSHLVMGNHQRGFPIRRCVAMDRCRRLVVE